MTGIGASLFHIFCCGMPFILLFLGLQSVQFAVFLGNNQQALWTLAGIFLFAMFFLQYRKESRGDSRSRTEKSLYIGSVLSVIVSVVLLYISYTGVPYVFPLMKTKT